MILTLTLDSFSTSCMCCWRFWKSSFGRCEHHDAKSRSDNLFVITSGHEGKPTEELLKLRFEISGLETQNIAGNYTKT
jgi:hypothetical protein